MPMRSVRCFSGTGSGDAATASRMASPRSRLWIGGVSRVGLPLICDQRPPQNTTPVRGVRSRRSRNPKPPPPPECSPPENPLANATRVAYSAPRHGARHHHEVGAEELLRIDRRGFTKSLSVAAAGVAAATPRWADPSTVTAQAAALKDVVPRGWLI